MSAVLAVVVLLHPGVSSAAARPDAQVAATDAKRLVVGDVPPHTTGAFRPFTIPGEIDEADGLVELRKGRTMTVWCPERVARERPDALAAARRFVDSPFLPVGSVSVAYVGDEAGAEILELLGVRFTKHDARSLPPPERTQVIALGPGAERGLGTPAEESAFRQRLATRTVLALPGVDYSLLPFGVARGRETIPGGAASRRATPGSAGFQPANAAGKKPALPGSFQPANAARPEAAPAVPELPVFSGIRRDFEEFLRLAGGLECDVVAGGPAWMLATSPACFAHLKNGSQSIIVMAVAPRDVPAATRAALTRVWCTILANLNVETPARTPDGQPLP